MAFTDPFIRRPVLATVVSLLIVLLGFQAWSKLPLRQSLRRHLTPLRRVRLLPPHWRLPRPPKQLQQRQHPL